HHQSPAHVFKRAEGIVAIRPEIVAKGNTFLPLTRVAVDAAEQEVAPRVSQRHATDLGLNVLDRQICLNLSLAVAAIISKARLQIWSCVLIPGVDSGCRTLVNGPHRRLR